MNILTLVGTIVGSVAFGAVAGKLLEAYLLAPISDRFERKRWLRERKIEAFTKLTEEMLSLGLERGLQDNPWRFRALGAKAILLIEDKKLINDIQKFIDELYAICTDLSTKVTSNLPDDFSITLPNGKKATKKDLERGVALDIMGKEAIKIADKLGKNLRNT